jgi:DNA-binding transcriptional ArsR family regulator
MSFHHTRRLTEHWPDNTKDLSPAVKLVAITITNHLNAKTFSFSISAKSLSKWTGGLSRSTIDKAVKELAELGILEVVRERQRQPRAFRLLVECPEGCERLQDHNTKLERSRQSEPPKTPEATSPEETSSSRLGNHLPQIEQRVSVDWATNRYPIDTSNKKDDMKKSFEILFITETLEALKTSKEFTANHALLEKALLEIPELIEEKAKAIQARATHSPQKYLLNSITNSPISLIPKQDPKPQEAKPEKFWTGLKVRNTWTGELAHYWDKLKENQEIVDWSELSKEHIEFLAELYKQHTPITNTAANLISEAAQRKIQFSNHWQYEPNGIKPPRSLTELSEILSDHKAKETPAVQ